MDATDLNLELLGILGLFVGSAIVIGGVGVRLARLADRLADATGLGEALFGAVLLGGATSLPGIVTSVSAAAEGYPVLAFNNAVGGIAVQTTFLAIADLAYRRSNLEHAAASLENLLQGALLGLLLALPLLAMAGPAWGMMGIHPISLALFALYLFGLRLIRRSGVDGPWYPRATLQTVLDHPPRGAASPGPPGIRLWLGFAAAALVVALAGYGITRSAVFLVEQTGLAETFVGSLMTAVSTSLPELVTTLAAIRYGALTLAVGGIIGGNSFDVLFLAFSDVAYRPGSLYHHVPLDEAFILPLALVLNGVLLLGLLRRERQGIANIGFESLLVLLIYAFGVWVLVSG